jgi:hypothetical protein
MSMGQQSPEGVTVTAWLSRVGIDTQNTDDAMVNAELHKAYEHLAEVIVALCGLHARAESAAELPTSDMDRARKFR